MTSPRFSFLSALLAVFCAAAVSAAAEDPCHSPADGPPAGAVDADREALILADRLLMRRGGGLFRALIGTPVNRQGGRAAPDTARQDALAAEIKGVLARIRSTCPVLAGVTTAGAPAGLLLELDAALVAGLPPDADDSTLPHPGVAHLTRLNAELGLYVTRQAGRLPYLTLSFARPVSRQRALLYAFRYRGAAGVVDAVPDDPLGDGSDIDAAKRRGVWHVAFRHAWGDCPSGCFYENRLFFIVDGERVERVPQAEAEAMPGFAFARFGAP